MTKQEIQSYVRKSMIFDNPVKHIKVVERYLDWLRNEPLHVTEDVKENLEPDIIKTAADIFEATENDIKPL